ncbi:MAG TPA: hypothetical protein VKU01_15300 [Bryobacteraceae bacterium]|nr:hypothetical protein [Bryobacteraceae bacterium]
MRLKYWLTAALLACALAQQPVPPGPRTPGQEEPDTKLPNGKSQRDAIAKEEYEKSLEDSRQLVKLATDLQAELEKNEAYVISVSEIKKTEDIEKMAKRIRGRLKHF